MQKHARSKCVNFKYNALTLCVLLHYFINLCDLATWRLSDLALKIILIMLENSVNTPKSWLAFELNILRRLEFSSVAFPFTNSPNLGNYLKNWNIRVLANDLLQAAFMDAKTYIENNGEELSIEEVEIVLEDAYVPQYQLRNESLRNWFNETDAWWFDNVRTNIERLESPLKQALALSLGMKVGDYVLSFDEGTRILRQPLSNVYRRFWSVQPQPINNGQNNAAYNKNSNEFTAENYTDLLFLRLPTAHNQMFRESLSWTAWREEWIRGGDDFWNDLQENLIGQLGTHIETKSQYLNIIEDILRTASHIKLWAIAHVEDSFISTQDLVETIGKVRRVDTIYSKDFSELLGTKAVIITA